MSRNALLQLVFLVFQIAVLLLREQVLSQEAVPWCHSASLLVPVCGNYNQFFLFIF